MERLREHLGVECWLMYGGSWGATLTLAYAERFPRRVDAIVLVAVTTTRLEEIDWLYHGPARLLPAEWEIFRGGVPPEDRDDDLVVAYDRLSHRRAHRKRGDGTGDHASDRRVRPTLNVTGATAARGDRWQCRARAGDGR